MKRSSDRDEESAAPTIVFAHANGFPAGTYVQVFEYWRAAGWRVLAVEKFGHDARYPVTSNWPHLRDQLLAFIDKEAAGAPVFLVGHSMGGYLSVLAASRRPELVRGVVLLDSPLLSGVANQVMRLGKATGTIGRYSPAHVSKGRRQHWPDAEAAYDHFAAKPAFARWAPGVLRDYIACGVQRHASGHEAGHGLAFRREVETAIYNTLPHHLGSLLRRHPLACPMAFVAGTQSVEVRRAGMRATERWTHGRVSWIDGSHLFPMEQPAAAAAQVLRWLGSFRDLPAA
ncbi:MAG TPA: alpha/beta hydrolase [Burkholderiaceae bacterium]|nr:alpha/beta hydrolase [Burkholderiaceae bacterium]